MFAQHVGGFPFDLHTPGELRLQERRCSIPELGKSELSSTRRAWNTLKTGIRLRPPSSGSNRGPRDLLAKIFQCYVIKAFTNYYNFSNFRNFHFIYLTKGNKDFQKKKKGKRPTL